MTSESAGPGGTADPADELRAAVRAVEQGERTAASFFPERFPERPGGRAPAPGNAPAVPPQAPAAGPAAAPGAAVPAAGSAGVPDGLTALLARGGAPEALAPRAAEALGGSAAQDLAADPWQLLAVPGVRPEQADGFARALLGPECGPGDGRRTTALTVWLLERAARGGHTAVESAALAKGLSGFAVPDGEAAARAAIEGGAVLAFHDPAEEQPTGNGGEDSPGKVLLCLERFALAEESLADGLLRLRDTFRAGSAPGGPGRSSGAARGPDGPGAAEGEEDEGGDGERPAGWDRAAAGAPTPSAAELIRAAARSGLLVHTGGEAARAEPAALVAAARSLGLRAYAAAHGPDGRRRLAALLGEEQAGAAVTLDGLLAGREGPGRGADGLLAVDMLVVLDASLLGAEAAAWLVESLQDGARLVLSGDPHLLGAAAPGRVLADVLAARCCPHVVSRTPDPGPIGELVSGVGAGELNAVAAPGREVVIVPVAEAGEAVHRTVQLVTDSIPRAVGRPAEQVQVITAEHSGAAGTEALNSALKERLNPGPGRFGGFDPGDRVAHSPFPGHCRMATVTGADPDGLWLEGDDGRFRVARQRVPDTVRHGWALTAHQAAASRWPAAVVVLPGETGMPLGRPWVYTALSRAEHHLSVVQGAGPALARAVAEPVRRSRVTRLRTLLRTAETTETG